MANDAWIAEATRPARNSSLSARTKKGPDSGPFLLWKDDLVVMEAFDGPALKGYLPCLACAHGGFKGIVGIAEDRAEAFIACRQVSDELRFNEKLPTQEDVFTERKSVLFKRPHVVSREAEDAHLPDLIRRAQRRAARKRPSLPCA